MLIEFDKAAMFSASWAKNPLMLRTFTCGTLEVPDATELDVLPAREALRGGLRRIAGWSRWLSATTLLIALAQFTACGTTPESVHPSSAPTQTIPPISELIGRGDAALEQGDRDGARSAWRVAAEQYPAATAPWLRLADDYLKAEDHGNAVLAAQQVLSRDPKNRVANGVIFVSGMRASASALAAFHEGGDYPVGAREEALELNRLLHQLLGNPVYPLPADLPANVGRAVNSRLGSPVGSSDNSETADGAIPKGLDKLK